MRTRTIKPIDPRSWHYRVWAFSFRIKYIFLGVAEKNISTPLPRNLCPYARRVFLTLVTAPLWVMMHIAVLLFVLTLFCFGSPIILCSSLGRITIELIRGKRPTSWSVLALEDHYEHYGPLRFREHTFYPIDVIKNVIGKLVLIGIIGFLVYGVYWLGSNFVTGVATGQLNTGSVIFLILVSLFALAFGIIYLLFSKRMADTRTLIGNVWWAFHNKVCPAIELAEPSEQADPTHAK